MSVFSSGNKYRQRAEEALNMAIDISEYQSNVDFQRGLLANIRQHRIASAQLNLLNYSDSFTSSSTAGAQAMLDTGLSDITRYSYETSQRSQEITDYQKEYEENMKKYAKQQKKKAGAFAVAGVVLGAVTGGIGFGVTGALSGASIGQGIGQIASNTGQFDTGLNNIISGASQAYRGYQLDQKLNEAPEFLLTSVDPATGKEMANTTVKATYTGGRLSAQDFYKY